MAAAVPHGTPPRLVPVLRQLIGDVFGHAYLAAMRPTLADSVGLLLAGVALGLLLRRSPATTTASDTTAADGAAAFSDQTTRRPDDRKEPHPMTGPITRHRDIESLETPPHGPARTARRW